jgi:hypothetical protein
VVAGHPTQRLRDRVEIRVNGIRIRYIVESWIRIRTSDKLGPDPH